MRGAVWVVLVLVAACVLGTGRVLAAQDDGSPRGLDFDGNTHVTLAGFNGFPQGSATLLFSIRTLASPFDEGPREVATVQTGPIVSVWSSEVDGLTFALTNPSNLQVLLGQAGNKRVRSEVGVSDGQWHSVGVVYAADGDVPQLHVHVDGRRAFTTAVRIGRGEGLGLFNGTSTLTLAKHQQCAGGCFGPEGLRARLREVSLWSRALTPEELAMYGEGIDVDAVELPSLVVYYPMDQALGAHVLDKGPNGLDGEMGAVAVVQQGDTPVFFFTGTTFLTRAFAFQFPSASVSLALWFQSADGGSEATEAALVSYSTKEDVDSLVLWSPTALRLQMAFVSYDVGVNVADGNWHHIAVVAGNTGGKVAVYVDGQVALQKVLPTDLAIPTTGFLAVAQRQGCYGGCFVEGSGAKGFIAGVRLWDTELTRSQVAADKGSPAHPDSQRTPAVVLAWEAGSVVDGRVVDSGSGGMDAVTMPQWVTECPKNCSSQGYCGDNGGCVCNAGFHGEDCSRGCPSNCNDHGTCVENQCYCFPMFEGEACETVKSDQLRAQWRCAPPSLFADKLQFCSMINHSIPEDVSSNAAALDAQAKAAFSKLAPTCQGSYGKKLLQSVVCGSLLPVCQDQRVYGVCHAMCNDLTRECAISSGVCDINAFASEADNTTCFSHSPEYEQCDCVNCCSNHGNCTDGACECDPGFTGHDCSTYTCPDASVPEHTPDFCSMVSYRVPDHVNQTWADEVAAKAFDLTKEFCPGSPHGQEMMRATLCATSFHACTTHGHVKPCRSMCQEYGAQCAISDDVTCFSDFYADPPNCFYLFPTVNATAETTAAPRVVPQCPHHFNCSNGGVCVDGTCQCTAPYGPTATGFKHGWGGRKCDVVVPVCPSRCNDRGVCADGKCHCIPGWFGDACQFVESELCDAECLRKGLRAEHCCLTDLAATMRKHEAHVTPCGANFSCSGHGECVNRSLCVCDEGYNGGDCGVVSARDGCPWDCSGHGECIESPTEFQKSIRMLDEAAESCCACEPGWTGLGCQLHSPCPNNCSGHGSCERGQCKCSPESLWMGIDCSFPAPRCGVEFECSNGGLCIDKLCRCAAGWKGRRCTTPDLDTPRCNHHFSCDPANSLQCNNVTGFCDCHPPFTGRQCRIDPSPLGATSAGFVGAGHLEVPDSDGDRVCESVDGTSGGAVRCRGSEGAGVGFGPRDDLTIEVWVKPTKDKEATILSKPDEYSIRYRGTSETLHLTRGDAAVYTDIVDFPLEQWFHVALVVNASQLSMQVYVNGISAGFEIVKQFPARAAGRGLQVGGAGSDGFEGQLADLRVWRYARSVASIRWGMHRRLLLPQAHLGAYLPFATAANITQNLATAQDGTVEGDVEWYNSGPHLAGKTSLNAPPHELWRGLSRRACTDLCGETAVSECAWQSRSPEARARGVCSATKVPQCMRRPYRAAQTACNSLGARLCSADEVLSGVAAQGFTDNGCGYDSDHVWTATTCQGTDSDGLFVGAVAVLGSPAGLATDEQCVRISNAVTRAVRCCADSALPSFGAMEVARSCLDAKRRHFATTSGVEGSGEYSVAPNGTDVFQVYCEQEVAGGGWTLIGNAAPSDDFPELGGSLFDDAVFNDVDYTSTTWDHSHTFAIPRSLFSDNGQLLLATGDSAFWCVVDANTHARDADGNEAKAVVVDALGFDARGGERTVVAVNGSVLVGCDGSATANKERTLWASGAVGPAVRSFKDAHRGVGLFASADHTPSPRAIDTHVDYRLRYGRAAFGASGCARVQSHLELPEHASAPFHVLVSATAQHRNSSVAAVAVQRVLGNAFLVCRSPDLQGAAPTHVTWAMWTGEAPNTQTSTASVSLRAPASASHALCGSVAFPSLFTHVPIVLASVTGNLSVPVWIADVGKGGFRVCVNTTQLPASPPLALPLRYLAYHRVPGPGEGVSAQIDAPLPPLGSDTACANHSLPFAMQQPVVPLLTVVGGVDAGGSAWVAQSTRRSFTVCVHNPSGEALKINFAAFGLKYDAPRPPQATPDPTPQSCRSAFLAHDTNTAHSTRSGTYRLRTTDPDSDSEYKYVYCWMEREGEREGGWMLVGNVPAGGGFLPVSVGQGPDAFSAEASVHEEMYDVRAWNRSNAYWMRHAGMESPSKVMLITGDQQVWCVLNLTQVREWYPIGEAPSVSVIASHNTTVVGGGVTSVVNEPLENGGRQLIACEGDFPDNTNAVLWSLDNAPEEWSCFVNAHGGVGVFVQ